MAFIFTTLGQAMCYAIVALGVYITYKVLDFPDLSVDGTFPLGAVVSVILIKNGGNPLFAVLVSLIAGGSAGALTGILHVKFRISNLLSGILIMTALVSVVLNLGRIKGNITTTIIFANKDITLFNNTVMIFFEGILKPILGAYTKNILSVILLFGIVAFIKYLLDAFLSSKAGFMLRASGNNEQLVTSMGKDVGVYKILGLSAANAIVAVGGAIYSQYVNSYNSTQGTGMVVIGLASVIIGWSIFKNFTKIKKTFAVVIGALIYMTACNFVIYLGLDSTYLKLAMAVIFAAVLIINYHLGNNNAKIRRGNNAGTDKR